MLLTLLTPVFLRKLFRLEDLESVFRFIIPPREPLFNKPLGGFMTEKELIFVDLLIEIHGAISVSHPLLAAYILEQLAVFDIYLDYSEYE